MCGRVMCYNLNRGLVLSCGEYNYRGQLGGGNEAAGAVTRGSEDTRPRHVALVNLGSAPRPLLCPQLPPPPAGVSGHSKHTAQPN